MRQHHHRRGVGNVSSSQTSLDYNSERRIHDRNDNNSNLPKATKIIVTSSEDLADESHHVNHQDNRSSCENLYQNIIMKIPMIESSPGQARKSSLDSHLASSGSVSIVRTGSHTSHASETSVNSSDTTSIDSVIHVITSCPNPVAVNPVAAPFNHHHHHVVGVSKSQSSEQLLAASPISSTHLTANNNQNSTSHHSSEEHVYANHVPQSSAPSVKLSKSLDRIHDKNFHDLEIIDDHDHNEEEPQNIDVNPLIHDMSECTTIRSFPAETAV